jgi:enoyl-CoA hydratase/carnithine racemase
LKGISWSFAVPYPNRKMGGENIAPAKIEELHIAHTLGGRASGPTSLRKARRLFDDLINVHLPVVASLSRPVVGPGCTVAIVCDPVVISDSRDGG